MLPFILYEISLFAPGDDPREGRKDLGWFMEALTQRDMNYLREHPDTPRLYTLAKQGKVKYIRPAQYQGECMEVAILRQALGAKASEPKVAAVLSLIQMVFGGERFRDIGRVIENGGGDCDNLAAMRAAELRQNGVEASPVLTWRPNGNGGTTYHALVIWPDGSSEDPSLLLGMGGEDRAADRAAEIAKNKERIRMIQSGEMQYKARQPVSPQALDLASLMNGFPNQPAGDLDVDALLRSLS